MFKKTLVLYSIFTCSVFAAAETSSPSREDKMQRATLTPKTWDDTIDPLLRTVPTLDSNTGTYVEKENLGAGVMRVFSIDGLMRVVLGKRFGKNWKISVGGAVEKTDKTFKGAITRELKEEYFGQLPFSSEIEPLSIPHKAGGISYDALTHKFKTSGWGPYFTFFILDYGYTEDQLKASLKIMNANAKNHTMLANYFADFDNTDSEAKKKGASIILEQFDDAIGTPGFVNMLPKARKALRILRKNGDHSLNMKGFDFAKQYVHIYSEYSEFIIKPLEKVFAEAEKGSTYFSGEEQARNQLKKLLAPDEGIDIISGSPYRQLDDFHPTSL